MKRLRDLLMEQAEQHVWNYMQVDGINTERISDTGTVENLLNDGWNLHEICAGQADDHIFNAISWLD